MRSTDLVKTKTKKTKQEKNKKKLPLKVHSIFSPKFTPLLLRSFQSLGVQDCKTLAEALVVFGRVKQSFLKPGSKGGQAGRSAERGGGRSGPPSPCVSTQQSH